MSAHTTRKFQVEHEGANYVGSYKILNGIMEVEYGGKTKSIELGNHDKIVVADLLMIEIIKEL